MSPFQTPPLAQDAPVDRLAILTGAVPPFEPFPKIARLKRPCVITEKLDGTNASVLITDHGDIFVGSRTRWVYPGKNDNYGFAGWVQGNRDEILKLGPGHHFGEWWGAGIQRRYGLTEKRFSLFNTARWEFDPLPEIVSLVPVLYRGDFTTAVVDEALADLKKFGSRAAPGFMNPEGVVIYHAASRSLFKRTIEGDENPKSLTVVRDANGVETITENGNG